MAQVTLQNVRKAYPNGFEAVKSLSLDVRDGEMIVLVGPSGCGKSTTLRLIAGLETLSDGTILIDGRVVNDVHPKDRDIAMVFQNYALYPHMSVRDNMSFALRMRRVPKPEIRRRVHDAARTLGIEDLLDRKPRQLSGGQRQRVAVGRAIVREPKAFLFDEPLSNLDAKLRVTTRAELKALHHRLNATTVYVTHDQEEAMTLGDRIVVMKDGLVQQAGPPLEVYRKPVNRFVASFIGTPPMNFLDGVLTGSPPGLIFVESGSGRLHLRVDPAHAAALAPRIGKPIVLGLRPQAAVDPGDASRPGLSPADLRVNVVEPLGDSMDLACTTPAGAPFVARIPARAGFPTGAVATFGIDMAKAHFFEPDGTERSLL